MIKKKANLILIISLILICETLTYQPAIASQPDISKDSSAIQNILTTEEIRWLEKNSVLRVGGPKAFPPFSFFDENGNEPHGIAYDYLLLIFNQYGVTIRVEKSLSWNEILNKAKNKEIDIISCAARTAEREDYLIFSEPYLSYPLVIISKKESRFIGGLTDLSGLKVAIVKQNVVFEWLKKDNIDVIHHFADSTLDCLRAVSLGYADAFIDNLASASYYIEKYGLANLKVAAPTSYQNYNLHFAVRRDFPELASIINKSLQAMSVEQHSTIRNKWLSVRYEYGITPKDILKWALIIVPPLFIVISLIIFWNMRLKREINERKLAEIALRESQRRFREIFENSRDGFVFVDADKKIIDANKAYCTMLGYTLEELKDKKDFNEITPNEWQEWEQQEIWEKRLMKDGYSGVYQKEYIRKDGTVFPVEIQAYSFFNSSSKPLYLWGIVRDTTSRKLAEQEREKLQLELYQSQKMESVGRLAGGVAHDFNNMLGVILGHTELALTQIDDKNPLTHKLTQIRNAAERSANLTRQLLAYARKQTIAPKTIDLNEAIEGMLKMLRSLIGENIDIAWLPGKALWQIKFDPTQLDQIITNLCVNARDAIKDNGKITIETENKSLETAHCSLHPGLTSGEYVQLLVSDSGCGMERETLDRAFEPFFTTKGVGKGTGLGLATVYGIVKQNNGFIYAYSEVNIGTTFKIYFPRHKVNIAESVEYRLPTATSGNETILLVEDNSGILEMAKEILEHLGYSVISASMPAEAIRLAENYDGRIDLLITDVVMPEMNGRDLAKNIISIYPNIKRLFMSGYTANVIAHHGILDSGVNFIQKPFSVEDIAAKVRQVLEDN